MNINFYVNGRKDVFKSKTAKKKLRNKMKKYNFFDLRNYWKHLEPEYYSYVNDNILFDVTFLKKTQTIDIKFNVFENKEQKEKEIARKKLREKLAEKKRNRKFGGSLRVLEEEMVEWRKDVNANQNEVDLYFEARKDYPNLYVPDPLIIKKNPRGFIREFTEQLQEIEKENPNSTLLYKYNPYVKYMRHMLDMEDEVIEEEIDI
jgi:hypothetical protein